MKRYTQKILRRIRSKGRGCVFTPKDFIDIAPRNAISQVLFQLVNQGIIRRLSRGIYDFPAYHEKIGKLAPDIDQIVRKVSDMNDVIQPGGDACANQLGLDNQVPSKEVYLTSGQSKRKRIGDEVIQLRHSKIVSEFRANPKLCKIILAFQHLGKPYINEVIIRKCRRILSEKDRKTLNKSLSHIPQWMVPFIKRLMENDHERVS